MSVVAGPQDIRIFLSGGTTNQNVNLSTGGSISNFFIPFYSRTFNNLWSDVSERQVRYGYKDIRVVYLKNVHSTLTFKNARVYWNQTDNFTSLQIGRAPVNSTENTNVSLAALLPTSEPIPPSMWSTAVTATDTFSIIQDTNFLAEPILNFDFGNGVNNQSMIGIHITDSSSTLINQKIARMTFRMRRFGTAHGNVKCNIRDFNTNVVKASLGEVAASAITTAAGQNQLHMFTNTNNTYACQSGDVITLEYPDGGQDETDGDPEDHVTVGKVEWGGDNPEEPPENSQYDVNGTEGAAFRNNGVWETLESGETELLYRAEKLGSGTPGGDPCNPDPGPGGPGTPPEEPRGFLIIQDFNDVNATTGYSIGAGGPNNAFRRAVKIDNTTATILSAPIARMTFLLRRIGNPTGSVFCRIWNSTGSVMETLGQLAVSGITNQGGQWTQVPFTLEENSYQMKVGDLIGVEYTTGNATDHIVAAGWTFQSATQASTDFEGSGVASATDKNGVKMVYANSGNFRYDWEIPSNSSSMRWDLSNPPINMEMTGYFQKSSPASDTVSCKIRGGKHTDGASSDGCCYIPQFPCEGGSMQFEIECPHPDNHDCPISGTHGSSLSLDQWHGYKVVVWNTTSNTVHIEAYQDKGDNSGGTPTNTWEKVFVHDDSSGNCGNISNPLLRPKGSTSQCTFRIDNNSGTVGKWLSVVEIQPGNAAPPGDGGGGAPGAHDVPGTSIARWNGSVWAADDGGNSDLVFKAERFAVIGDEPDRDPIIVDPGTKRKPTSFDQGIVIPPLGPGDYKSLILERLFPPDADKVGQIDVLQQIVVEVDSTTEPSQPSDANQPITTLTSVSEIPVCPTGQHYDSLQKVCVLDSGSAGTTTNGIVLPSLPTPNYKLDAINYTVQPDHKANGSFREHFPRGTRDLNSVMVGGYVKCDGPDDEEITAKLGGGVQTPSNAGIAGRCYNIDISLDGKLVTVTKEARHAEYHDVATNNTINLGPRQGHYTGVIFMKANIMRLGDPAVRLMAWADTAGMNDSGTFTSANQNWVQVLDVIDSGYWYDKPWITGAVPGDSVATIRTDQQDISSYNFKFGFCARIKGGPAY